MAGVRPERAWLQVRDLGVNLSPALPDRVTWTSVIFCPRARGWAERRWQCL